MASASLRNRLERLRARLPVARLEQPAIVAYLDDRTAIALVRSAWVAWSGDQPLPSTCKVYGFDPRGV